MTKEKKLLQRMAPLENNVNQISLETQETTQHIKDLESKLKHVGSIDRRFALVQAEWHKYERAYVAYVAKQYRIRDWIYRRYINWCYRESSGLREEMVRRITARRMARVFAQGVDAEDWRD